MKKLLLITISLFALAAFFTACEEEEDKFYTGVAFNMSDVDYYILDPGIEGVFETSLPNKILEVTMGGSPLGDGNYTTNADGSVAYTLSQADFGNMPTGSDTLVTLMTTVDGGGASQEFTVSVPNPLTLEGPGNVPLVDTTAKIKFSLAADCTAPTSFAITLEMDENDPVAVDGDYDMLNDSLMIVIDSSMGGHTFTYNFEWSNENGTISASHTFSVIHQFTDFEEFDAWSSAFEPWETMDNDGLNTKVSEFVSYPGMGEPATWMIFDFEGTTPAEMDGWEPYNGTQCAVCFANDSVGQTNDDWMVSDYFKLNEFEDVTVKYEAISFYAKSLSDSLDRIVVEVINLSDNSVTTLTGDGTVDYDEVPTDWTNYELSLADFAGEEIKVQFGCVSDENGLALFVDDFTIVTVEVAE